MIDLWIETIPLGTSSPALLLGKEKGVMNPLLNKERDRGPVPCTARRDEVAGITQFAKQGL